MMFISRCHLHLHSFLAIVEDIVVIGSVVGLSKQRVGSALPELRHLVPLFLVDAAVSHLSREDGEPPLVAPSPLQEAQPATSHQLLLDLDELGVAGEFRDIDVGQVVVLVEDVLLHHHSPQWTREEVYVVARPIHLHQSSCLLYHSKQLDQLVSCSPVGQLRQDLSVCEHQVHPGLKADLSPFYVARAHPDYFLHFRLSRGQGSQSFVPSVRIPAKAIEKLRKDLLGEQLSDVGVGEQELMQRIAGQFDDNWRSVLKLAHVVQVCEVTIVGELEQDGEVCTQA